MLRLVELKDRTAITDIYNHYIENTAHTFAEDLIDTNYIQEQIKSSLNLKLPYLVYTQNNTVIAYAYAAQWKPRSAYRFTVETSVYLHPEHQGKGIGKQIYSELIRQIKSNTQVRLILAGITLPNPASIALHEKLGFKKSAHFNEIGYKFDEWLDVGYWTLKV